MKGLKVKRNQASDFRNLLQERIDKTNLRRNAWFVFEKKTLKIMQSISTQKIIKRILQLLPGLIGFTNVDY